MKTTMLVVALSLIALSESWAADPRVGGARVVINPPRGTPLAGYYRARQSEDVLDDIYAKAMVLESAGTKAAFVVCDLLSLPRPVIAQTRRLIETQTGIPGGHVMISMAAAARLACSTRPNCPDSLPKPSRKRTASSFLRESASPWDERSGSHSIAATGCATARWAGIPAK